jgi:RNA polymerase primary sigma factor
MTAGTDPSINLADMTTGAVPRAGSDGRPWRADPERQAMILRHRRLAYKMARRYEGFGVDREDLEQEAISGLIKAVDRFDPTRGTAFSTYATYWIRRSLQEAVARGSLIRTPDFFKRRRRRPRVVSLDAPIGADGDLTVADAIPDPWSVRHDPLARFTHALARERLHQLVDLLPPREREVIHARFGFGFDDQPKTLKEIGDGMGISHTRAGQILGSALRHLRHTARLVRLQELTDDVDTL